MWRNSFGQFRKIDENVRLLMTAGVRAETSDQDQRRVTTLQLRCCASAVRARLNEEKTTGLSPTSRMMEFASQGPPGLRLLRRLGWPVWPYLQRWSGWPLISWWAPSLGYVAEYAGTPGSSSTSDSARILGDSDPLQVIDGSIVRTSGRLDPFFARFV
ncbi:uncharacterized protein LOC143904347 isoform X2 [Temnothorax americanus]|uniref:uncharacterized protein LOC143904347 isoform X2 n=1 Tax=Temnothorax americanus TaxID=1964332 RepID=UPI004068A415